MKKKRTAIDRLWAPWRIKYVRSAQAKKCIFCQNKKKRRKNYVIFITRYSACMLNIFPYNNGHMMIFPLRHIGDLGNLRNSEILDLMCALNAVKRLLDKVLKPKGYNIGINLGAAAGAGINGHLHIHIVPRWIGDTNFMPVIYNTKVVSQSLDELYKQLKDAQSETD